MPHYMGEIARLIRGCMLHCYFQSSILYHLGLLVSFFVYYLFIALDSRDITHVSYAPHFCFPHWARCSGMSPILPIPTHASILEPSLFLSGVLYVPTSLIFLLSLWKAQAFECTLKCWAELSEVGCYARRFEWLPSNSCWI